MVIEADMGTVLTIVGGVGAAFWGMLKLMFMQYEKRQDNRFETLTATLTEQKDELDEHMKKQDSAMAEIKRVEGLAMAEIKRSEGLAMAETRRIEAKLNECQLDALQRFQTRAEASDQHKQILDAIHQLGHRIDKLHGVAAGTQ